MISVIFISKDKFTGQVLKSPKVYFQELNILVTDLIQTNQELIQTNLPNCKVFALIENEGEEDGHLFI